MSAIPKPAGVSLPYVDAELDHAAQGDQLFWRHFHWGYFTDPERRDDSPERYLAAAERMTEKLVNQARIANHTTVLDVGCGFGGTLDHIRTQHRGCRLHGVNIDHRQLHHAHTTLNDVDRPALNFATADACALPYPADAFDHILAVECVFHFPSRKTFLRQAAAALKPGGTLTLSDFLVAPGALGTVAKTMAAVGLGEDSWYGRLAKPVTAAGYRRLGRAVGLQLTTNRDVTADTLPTYPALRRLHRETEARGGHIDPQRALGGLATTDALETLAIDGHLLYNVLTFTRPGADLALPSEGGEAP